MNFFSKYFFSKCDQIGRKQRIWSHLLKKYLMENLIFCAVFKDYEKVRETWVTDPIWKETKFKIL